MAFTRAWRNFKRMQDTTVAIAALIYAGAVVRGFEVLPGDGAVLARWTLVWPALYFLVSVALPVLVGPVRRALGRWVWMSFRAGFGQTPGSIVSGALLLMGAGVFIYWQIEQLAAGAAYGANVFSAFAAGIGILAVQALLTRVLERNPEVRKIIVEPEGA